MDAEMADSAWVEWDDAEKKFAKKEMRLEYEEALKGGEVNVAYSRVSLIGPAAVGKTSLKHGLMNKPLPQFSESTVVASVDTVKPISHQWAKAGKTYWEEVSEKDELEEMAQLMALLVQKRKDRGVRKKMGDKIKKIFLTPPAVAEFRPDAAPKSSAVDKMQAKKIKSHEVEEVFRDILRHAPEITSPKLDPEVWLHVWDSGGQPVFLDVLPAFLTSRTMFLLLFNASKDLKHKWDVLETIKGIQRKTDYGELSTSDLLHQWMTAIFGLLARHNKSGQLVEYPRIVLVGTHGDQADKAVVEQEIESHCTGKLYSDMLYLPPLVVDNTTAGRGEDEDPAFSTIRERVHEMTSSKLSVRTPVTWVLFRKVLEKLGKKVMQLGETRTVAEACHIGKQAVPAVLMFYHEVGALLFYPHIKSLQNMVITDPKWLVDQLGKLLTLEGKVGFESTRTLWPLFFDKGIVLESLYKAVWEDCAISPDALMDLLVHFLLAAPVPPTGLHDRSGRDKEFFLPCSLKFYHGDPAKLLINHEHQAAPLFITFETLGFVPPGFFTRLISSLVSIPGCNESRALYKINFSKPVHRNCITFSCQDPRGHEVTLTELPHAFQISVAGYSHNCKSLRSVCQRLLLQFNQCCKRVHHVLYGLQKTMTIDRELMPAMNISHQYALLCQSPKCTFPSPHYCNITPGDDELFCSQSVCQSLPSQMYWLASEISSTAATQPQQIPQQLPSTAPPQSPLGNLPLGEVSNCVDGDTHDAKPEMNNLMKWISPEAASRWRMIGHLLKIPPGSLDSIGHDNRTAEDALSAVFTEWSRSMCSPYSWKTILDVLATDAVGHRRLANEISSRLSEPQHIINPQQLPSSAEAQSPLGSPALRETSTYIDYDSHSAEPEMNKLMVWISPEAANEWKMIGHFLKVPAGSLDSIERDSPTVHDALLAVFTAWRRTMCSPYSWKIILKVLATNMVGHRRLANDIARRLSGTTP